jgi:hypothetical protein
MMKRREFITLLGGGVAWPLAARAQQAERMRRIGVLTSAVESDPRGLEYITAFAQGLAELGWTVGRNVRVDRGRVAAGKPPHRTDRVRVDDRSGRRRMGREPVATRYECHRICRIRIQHERQMAGTAQGDRARHKASGGHSRSLDARRLRWPGGDPDRRTFVER